MMIDENRFYRMIYPQTYEDLKRRDDAGDVVWQEVRDDMLGDV